MTKENIKRMLTEMIERDFDIDEIAHMFCDINNYLGEKRAAEIEDRQEYKESHMESAARWRKWTEETLSSLGLDYTIEEIEA